MAAFSFSDPGRIQAPGLNRISPLADRFRGASRTNTSIRGFGQGQGIYSEPYAPVLPHGVSQTDTSTPTGGYGQGQGIRAQGGPPATGGVPPTGPPPVTGPIPTPRPTGGGKGGKGGGGGPSPLDAEYYQNVANYLFRTNNSIANANQAIGLDRTALQAALGQLGYQQPRSDLALEQQANQNGALYSSAYGQNLANLNYQYAGREAGLTNSANDKIAQLAQQIAQLRGGIPLYENAQAYLAAQRAAAAAAKNPAAGPHGANSAGRSSFTGKGGTANPRAGTGQRSSSSSSSRQTLTGGR